MIGLSRYSERFAASGGMGARATRRTLGPRTLGFWEVFLRETLQNSWDARRSSMGPISFSIDAWTASTGQRTVLRDYVLTDPPPRLGLESALEDPALTFLAVSDGGTWGLSGPTRADVDPGKDRSDFVDFIRDTGRRAEKGFAGGTYGFGKVVLCEASAVSTVVIYTKTMMSDVDGSRFIAMAIGDDEYKEHGVRYTGRHWWGTLRESLSEPLLGPEADAAAFALGMHTLIKGVSGTAILVVAPRSPDASTGESLQEITDEIARSAAEYAWPHMLPGRAASIDLQVTLDKKPVQVPTPATDPRLRVFADAFARCQQLADGGMEPGDSWPWHHRILKSSKPAKDLGTLAWHQALPPVRPEANSQPQAQVALIRNPHFVVTYRDAPIHPSGGNTYGVFLGAPELDAEYAASENQTHSEWKPRKGVHFDPARRVLHQINDEIRERPKGGRPLAAGAGSSGVVSIASVLGVLLDGQTAIGDSRIPWFPEEHSKTGDGPQGTKPRARTDLSAWPSYPTTAPAPATSEQPLPSDGSLDRPVDPDDPPAEFEEPYLARSEEPSRQYQGKGDDGQSALHLRPPTVRLIGDPQLCVYDGVVAAEFPFRLWITRGLREVTVSGNPMVFVDGGRETEPPLDADMPRVLAWRDLSTGNITEGSRLALFEPTNAKWSVLISQLPDAAVGVDVSVESYG